MDQSEARQVTRHLEQEGLLSLCAVLRQANPDALLSVTKDTAVSLYKEKGL